MLDIWYIPFEAAPNPDYSILNDAEQIKLNRFHHLNDKKNYAIAHVALRRILSSYLPSIKPHEWSFASNEFGKPFITTPLDTKLSFNLSHCQSHAYIAISTHLHVGIDTEQIKPIEINDALIEMICSRAEKRLLLDFDTNETLFYTLWTLKESHLKALGTGLTDTLNELDFSSYCTDFHSDLAFSTSSKEHHFSFLKNGHRVALAVIDHHFCDIPNFFTISDL